MKGGTGYWDIDTDDKLALLETSWNAGHSSREIATALIQRFGGKVTRNAVVSKAHRLGLRMHQSPHTWRFQGPGRRA